MKTTNLIGLLVALFLTSTVSAQTFGEPVKPQLMTEVDAVLANPAQFVDKEITVKGEVTKVCKKRGCWLTVVAKGSNDELRVKVRDGVMVFPLNSIGKQATITGTLQGRSMNLEQTRNYYAHIAEEQGDEFDPASVTEPMVHYQVVPSGVDIAN